MKNKPPLLNIVKTQTQTLRTFQYWGCTQMYS